MTWFVDLDSNGRFKGFHNPELTGRAPPETAKPISEEQYQAWLAAGGDGYHWPDDADAPVPYVPNDAEKLEKTLAWKIPELRSACAAAIVGGCTSDALGATYTYPTQVLDQQNLVASVTAALIDRSTSGWTTPFLCANAEGEWAFRDHTAKQIIQVGKDVKDHIASCRLKLDRLMKQVNEAKIAEEAEPIMWGA